MVVYQLAIVFIFVIIIHIDCIEENENYPIY